MKKNTGIFGKILATILAFVFVGVAGVSAYCLIDTDFRKQVEQKLHINKNIKTDEFDNGHSEEVSQLENELKNKETQLSELQSKIDNNNQIISDLKQEKAMLENDKIANADRIAELEEEIYYYEHLNTETVMISETFESNKRREIDLANSESVFSVYNVEDAVYEDDYFVSRYGTELNKNELDVNLDDIDGETKRFISHDGDKMFCVLDNKLVAYKNENYTLTKILDLALDYNDIFKISSFDNFVFIFTKSDPYIRAYMIENNVLVDCSMDLTSFEFVSSLSSYIDIDMIQSNNGTFMLGFYSPIDGATAYTLYLTFDDTTKLFTFNNYVSTVQTEYNYLLAFHKSKYTETDLNAFFLYLKSGETASKCKRAMHDSAGKVTTSYNVTTYYYTYGTINITIKNRFIFVFKNISPVLWVYGYPEIFRYADPTFEEYEIVDYRISASGFYYLFKLSDGSFKLFSTETYYNMTEITLPETIDYSQVQDFEFLDDVIIFFNSDKTETVLSINEDKLYVENVVGQNKEYVVKYEKLMTLPELVEYVGKLKEEVNVYKSFIISLYSNLEKYENTTGTKALLVLREQKTNSFDAMFCLLDKGDNSLVYLITIEDCTAITKDSDIIKVVVDPADGSEDYVMQYSFSTNSWTQLTS